MSPGEFRIAVTFQEEGQQVEILEPEADSLSPVTWLNHLLSKSPRSPGKLVTLVCHINW